MSEEKRYLVDEFLGVVISDYNEQKQLISLAITHYFEFLDPELESEKLFHPMWGIHHDSIGLVGTQIMRNTPAKNIIHGVAELQEYFKKESPLETL